MNEVNKTLFIPLYGKAKVSRLQIGESFVSCLPEICIKRYTDSMNWPESDKKR